MSDLRLDQIVVSADSGTDWLYGLDENGQVWVCQPGESWSKLPMAKAKGEE